MNKRNARASDAKCLICLGSPRDAAALAGYPGYGFDQMLQRSVII